MVRCCFCGSIHKKNYRRTYHKFPLSDKFLLEQWVNNIPLKYWKPTNESLLCSDHFTEDCFDRSEFRVRLKLNSVPTYFGDSPAVCIICKRKRSRQSPYSFFRFPLEKQELLNKWLENINMLNWQPTETSRLCSSHFEASYLRKVKGKYWALKENSIPTILNSTNILDSTELLASKENISPLTSNIMNSHSSHTVLTNPILVNEARKESCYDVSNIIVRTLDNSDDAETESTSIQFDSTASSVCKSQQIVDHDHQYESPPTILRRRLFECEQKLKEKKKIIKMQKRKLNQLQKKASYFRDVINELRRSVKVQVSEACLRSLESIDDSDIQKCLQRVMKVSHKSNFISRMQYPPALRSFALTLFYYSPKAYNYVRDKMNLALSAPSTLRLWYNSSKVTLRLWYNSRKVVQKSNKLLQRSSSN